MSIIKYSISCELSLGVLSLIVAMSCLDGRSVRSRWAFDILQVLECICSQLRITISFRRGLVFALNFSCWKENKFRRARLHWWLCSHSALGFAFLNQERSTVMKSISSIKRFLILRFVFGVIKIFATAHKINSLIFSWSWELFESLEIFRIRDEVVFRICSFGAHWVRPCSFYLALI